MSLRLLRVVHWMDANDVPPRANACKFSGRYHDRADGVSDFGIGKLFEDP